MLVQILLSLVREIINSNQSFQKLPFTFICLRGNHEARVKTVMDKNPDGWETISKYDGSIFVEKEFPYIEYLADGPAVYNFKSYKNFISARCLQRGQVLSSSQTFDVV